MNNEEHKRRLEELKRCLNRIESLYNGQIITGNGEDSLQSPKDLVLNFFRVSYELKENLKLEIGNKVEDFCNQNELIALALDIGNIMKHGKLDRPKTKNTIGNINSGIHVLDPNGHDRTELTIEIDGKKEDCLRLATKIFTEWRNFYQLQSID